MIFMKPSFKNFFKTPLGKTIISIALIIVVLPLFAFEAHVVNVTATIVQIDPPMITPPGGSYEGPIDMSIDDDDPDAVYIFYTITPGTDPSLAPDPACGIFPGGVKPIGPITLTDDSVVKAIACDGDSVTSHGSLITTEIYDLSQKGKIEGRKYHDLDESGDLSEGDTTIEGWRVTLFQGTTTLAITITDGTGYYTFTDLDSGSYTVVEEEREGWQPTSPTSENVVVGDGTTETVNFFNFDTGFSCLPESVLFPDGLALQAGGTSSGNDDVVLANNVTVNGSVRSNDEIEKTNSNGLRTINGNATTTTSIDAGITVNGATLTGAPTEALPDIMIPLWKSKAGDGGTVNGNFTFPNNTVGLSMGPVEILGNVSFGSSNSVTIKGPIYIHGNLTIGSNSTVIEDPAFGNQFVPIIVDGIISISSNVTFAGSGGTGAFLLVSTASAVSGVDAAIETSSNNSDLGDVVLYASEGDIHIRSNRTLLAAFAAHGTGDDSDENGAIRIDSNVTVNYRALPRYISCGSRQPFESSSHVLINEFMPNPSGSDTGVLGGELDGEWVELFNPTAGPADVTGFMLYDNDNTHALPITTANTDTGSTVIPSLGFLVVYREGDADFQLNNAGGDSVRLLSADIGSGGTLIDSHAYVRDAADEKSFARVPDGSSNWIDPEGTPGMPNMFFFEPIPEASFSSNFNPPDLPPIVIEMPNIDIPIVMLEPEINNVTYSQNTSNEGESTQAETEGEENLSSEETQSQENEEGADLVEGNIVSESEGEGEHEEPEQLMQETSGDIEGSSQAEETAESSDVEIGSPPEESEVITSSETMSEPPPEPDSVNTEPS